MKITKSLFAFAFVGLLAVGCKQTASEPSTAETASAETSTEGKIQTASFNIDGMSCSVGCAKTIEKKLAQTDGVKEASVDFEKKIATVKFDDAKQSPEKLVEIVESSADGKTYKVSDVKSSGDQAMLYGDGDKNKEKKKKKKKKAEAEAAEAEESADKKDASATETKAEGKPACCSSKKASSCSKEKSTL